MFSAAPQDDHSTQQHQGKGLTLKQKPGSKRPLSQTPEDMGEDEGAAEGAAAPAKRTKLQTGPIKRPKADKPAIKRQAQASAEDESEQGIEEDEEQHAAPWGKPGSKEKADDDSGMGRQQIKPGKGSSSKHGLHGHGGQGNEQLEQETGRQGGKQGGKHMSRAQKMMVEADQRKAERQKAREEVR